MRCTVLKMIAQQPHNDQRKTPRFPIGNLVAELDLLDGNEPVLVCIWDLSLGGACLMVPPDLELPAQFDLYIDGLCHPVEKIWQRWCYAGVHLRLANATDRANATQTKSPRQLVAEAFID
jgi:hypothetical protein